MPKSSRSRRRPHRAPQRPPATRPLELAQRRATAARDLAEPLAERIEEFIDTDGRLATRREIDRWLLAGRLLELVVGWGSLAAGTDEGRAGRLLTAGLIDVPDPGFLWWVLEWAELKQAARDAASEGKRRAAGLAAPPPHDDFEPGALSLPDHLGEHLERLRAALVEGGATSEMAESVARDLVEQRLVLLLRGAENGHPSDPVAALLTAVAGGLLGLHLPVVEATFAAGGNEMLEGVREAVRQGEAEARDADPFFFFEPFSEPEEGDDDYVDPLEGLDDDDLDDDDHELDEVRFRSSLRLVDRQLRFVSDPVEAAPLAHLTATLLCAAALGRLASASGTDALGRLLPAVLITAGTVPGGADEVEADLEEVSEQDQLASRAQLERACAVLESGLELARPQARTDDENLRWLDRLIIDLTRVADDDEEEHLGSWVQGLGWAGAAAEAARLAVDLSSGDPERQREFAPLLAVLDPLALVAAHPDLRRPAAATLRKHLSS